MDAFNADLNRVLRYSMDTVENLMGQLASPEHNATRWGQGDQSLRNVLSDALRENERHTEADLLADDKQHVLVHEGRVRPAKCTFAVWNDMIEDARHAYHTALDAHYENGGDVPALHIGDLLHSFRADPQDGGSVKDWHNRLESYKTIIHSSLLPAFHANVEGAGWPTTNVAHARLTDLLHLPTEEINYLHPTEQVKPQPSS